MLKFIAVTLFISSCANNSSKLDAVKENCGDKNLAAKLVKSEDKNAECEEYFCDEGQTHYYGVKCKTSNNVPLWASVDTLQGPVLRLFGGEQSQPQQGPQSQPQQGPQSPAQPQMTGTGAQQEPGQPPGNRGKK